MSTSPEDRTIRFQAAFEQLVTKHGIHKSSLSTTDDAHRIAHLLSIEMIKLYGASIGQDAAYEFFEWTREQKLTCQELPLEFFANGKPRPNPFTSIRKKLYPKLSFRKYLDLAEEILFPPREPILKREPVCIMGRTL